MKLTKEEQESLESLSKHPWMKVWKKLWDDFVNQLWAWLVNLNLNAEWFEESLKILKLKQVESYMFKEVLQQVVNWKAKIYSPTIKEKEKELLKHL